MKQWHDNFTFLFRKHGRKQQHPWPADFDTLMARGQGKAGSPATITKWLRSQVETTGANYIVGHFGDLSAIEAQRSVELFARHVMPSISMAPETVL